jgi:Uncharacterised nucleotidyltransferase
MMIDLLSTARLLVSPLRLDATPASARAALVGAGRVDWTALLRHADAHTLAPLLYDAWRQAGVLDRVPAEPRARLAKAYADNTVRNGRIRGELLDVHQLLNAAQVPHLVLKGWPLVERLYADPAQRFMSDQDFLVPAERATIGHQALRAAGFRPLPAKDEWIEKHLPSLWRNDGYHWDGYLYDPDYPRPVELHVRLWELGWRGLAVRDLPDVWPRAATRVVAGLPMQVLSDEDTLVHLSMHFAGHLVEREARLNQLLDLARFVATTPGLDWPASLALAKAAGVSRFVYASLWFANQVFAAPLPPAEHWQALARLTPPAFRNWLAAEGVADALTTDYRQRSKGQDYKLTFLAARSLGERLGIARFALLPPMGQLAAKYHLRHAWLGPLLYPRHLAERARDYGRGVLRQ